MPAPKRAQRYNTLNAAHLPPGGEQAWPVLYAVPRDDDAFYQAVRAFQLSAHLEADGFFGPKTRAAFEQQFTPEPDIEDNVLASFEKRVWVGWGALPNAELKWLKQLGVDTLILNVNKANSSQAWVPEMAVAEFRTLVDRIHAAGMKVLLMVWMWRTSLFNKQAAAQTLALAHVTGADGVQFDVEGSWVFSAQTPGLSHTFIVKANWAPYWIDWAYKHYNLHWDGTRLLLNGRPFVYETTPLYFLRGAVDALNAVPQVTITSPQGYGQYDKRPTKKAESTRVDWFRSPSIQKRCLANYLPLRARGDFKKLIIGLGAWWQDAPGSTPYLTMRSAAFAAKQGGADGISWWGLHTLQPDRGSAWRAEKEHREAFEQVMTEL